MRRPGVVDAGAMREQPAADHGLGEAGAFLARGGGGEIAQPGEALQLLGDRARAAERGEVELGERHGLAADREAAGEQRFAALAVAGDMVARDGGELQRLARTA